MNFSPIPLAPRALTVLGALALLAGACGGGSNSDKTNTPAAAATQPSSQATPTKPAGAATTGPTAASTARTEVDDLKVTAVDFSFSLNLTSIHPGAPGVDVQFENHGATTHSLAFYADSGYTTKIAESQPVAPAASSGFPFIPPNGATKVYYRCEIHPAQMNGELAVQ